MLKDAYQDLFWQASFWRYLSPYFIGQGFLLHLLLYQLAFSCEI